MDINISCSANEHIRIFINGNLAGEVAINKLESHSNLLQDIAQAKAKEF